MTALTLIRRDAASGRPQDEAEERENAWPKATRTRSPSSPARPTASARRSPSAGRGRRAHRHRRYRAGDADREDGRAGRPPGARLPMRCDVGAVGRRHGGGGAEEIRPLRHPHQLRRHLSAAGFRADEIRGLAPRAVDQSRQRVPGQLGIRARHEAARLGPRRQHGVEHARLRRHRLRALHVEQGRHRRLHPRAGDASSAPTASPSTRSRRA